MQARNYQRLPAAATPSANMCLLCLSVSVNVCMCVRMCTRTVEKMTSPRFVIVHSFIVEHESEFVAPLPHRQRVLLLAPQLIAGRYSFPN